MATHVQHLILYDGECGLCDRTVQMLLKIDTNQIFAFAPLGGPTANQLLAYFPKELTQIDSAILIEDFQTEERKIYSQSSTVFRFFWLEGGWWKIIGLLFFLPPFLFNWAYEIVSRNRYFWVARSCFVPIKNQKERFLP